MSDSQVFQTLLDDGRRAFNQRYHEDENDMTDEEKERERIKKALDEHNGCIPCTAKALGISERTLVRKKKEYGL
jgi:transcriptional regulator with PAS, ATPase and Fis domain